MFLIADTIDAVQVLLPVLPWGVSFISTTAGYISVNSPPTTEVFKFDYLHEDIQIKENDTIKKNDIFLQTQYPIVFFFP